ncbi:hypothetical protein [Victivallis sp. Marseille-Q1083]|uniref:hypothetical protein n=1 Tax=Victivallis sp. Marseille-Q1083 TaxID=2717288 RepID=UPI001589086B|nr:hypothetical protein [Victivallis sp. Marseille-Q1083]
MLKVILAGLWVGFGIGSVTAATPGSGSSLNSFEKARVNTDAYGRISDKAYRAPDSIERMRDNMQKKVDQLDDAKSPPTSRYRDLSDGPAYSSDDAAQRVTAIQDSIDRLDREVKAAEPSPGATPVTLNSRPETPVVQPAEATAKTAAETVKATAPDSAVDSVTALQTESADNKTVKLQVPQVNAAAVDDVASPLNMQVQNKKNGDFQIVFKRTTYYYDYLGNYQGKACLRDNKTVYFDASGREIDHEPDAAVK